MFLTKSMHNPPNPTTHTLPEKIIISAPSLCAVGSSVHLVLYPRRRRPSAPSTLVVFLTVRPSLANPHFLPSDPLSYAVLVVFLTSYLLLALVFDFPVYRPSSPASLSLPTLLDLNLNINLPTTSTLLHRPPTGNLYDGSLNSFFYTTTKSIEAVIEINTVNSFIPT